MADKRVGLTPTTFVRHCGPVPNTYLLCCFSVALAWGCATVDPGESVPGAPLMIDEDFFYCRIMPEVIIAQSCASGGAGDGGGCHAARSALRLRASAETDPPPACDGDSLVGALPPSYRANFQSVQFTVQPDPLSSSFYRSPVALDPHPRMIFPEGSIEADLIFEWIGDAGP